MKVALYYPWIYLTSGVERVIVELVKRSKHDYTIFTNRFDRPNTYADFNSLKVIQLSRVPVQRDLVSVARAAVTVALQRINLSSFDVLFVHSDGLGDLILLRNTDIPVVCFCHTPLRPVFDEIYRKHAVKRISGGARMMFYMTSAAFKYIDQFLWRRYRYVIFNSRETLRRAKEGGLLHGLKGKYEILHPGITIQKPSWIYKPYFFLPGRIMWTKNIELAIRSFIRFKRIAPRHQNFRLIIAGQVDAKSRLYVKKLRKIIQKRGDVTVIVSPSEKKLKKLYTECWAVLLTSFNEDWGLTLLEGNSFGKPSITVNIGGPKESQIDGVTGFIANANTQSLSQKMALLAGNERLTKKLGASAYHNVKQYGWEHFVRRIDQILIESR